MVLLKWLPLKIKRFLTKIKKVLIPSSTPHPTTLSKGGGPSPRTYGVTTSHKKSPINSTHITNAALLKPNKNDHHYNNHIIGDVKKWLKRVKKINTYSNKETI